MMDEPECCNAVSCETPFSGPRSATCGNILPILRTPNYFTVPSVDELAARERAEPDFCSRVGNFIVGCQDYGSIKFFGETDVRRLDVDSIVHFRHQEVIVYPDESTKPCVGYGLNKPAEVAFLRVGCKGKVSKKFIQTVPESETFVEKLKKKLEAQRAKFISYDICKQELRFQVEHFSRFGLDDSDEDDEPMNVTEASPTMNAEAAHDDIPVELGKSSGKIVSWQPEMSEDGSEELDVEGSPMEELRYDSSQSALAHSLPQHLRLDPLKMQQMKMLFFSSEEEASVPTFPKVSERLPYKSKSKTRSPGIIDTADLATRTPGWKKDQPLSEESSPKSVIFSKHIMKISPQASWKPLLSHSPSLRGRHLSVQSEQGGSPVKHSRMLLSLERKHEISSLKKPKVGFENKLDLASCMYGRSGDIVDAALFLGCSFRVGWGPQGILVHSGNPVGIEGSVLSSIVHVEKVSLDACVRDKEGKVRDELIELQFISPLKIHVSLSRVFDGMDDQAAKMRLRFVQCTKHELQSVCDKYEDLLVKQHAVEGLSASQLLVLRHQVMTWHLLSVLFSEKSASDKDRLQEDEVPETLDDAKAFSPVLDPQLAALIRRADFSRWLQDSVRLAIREEIRDLEASDHLKVLFSHLTGRQLDEAVQVAALRGDVRLACLVSQAGSSMSARRDIAHQLDAWEKEGLDFSLIERDMILLYKLLSGDIEGALKDRVIDWKRFMGMLMWYRLAPETHITEIIRAYSFLIEQHAAPLPVPMYVEEEEAALNCVPNMHGTSRYDTAYYLMLLYASQGQNFVDASKMFSSFSSTYDPLDHRMAWLQHKILESIEVLTPTQMHILDMNFMSQLLSVGECHWALYVALHMSPSVDYPSLHERVVKHILSQYCEVWSTSEVQQTFIEKELGLPSEWLHEALGTYWQYNGDKHKAMLYFLQSKQWQRAHLLLVISVGATLFLAGEHDQLFQIVSSLERNKMELADWDLSGAIYADFLQLKSSFRSDEFNQNGANFASKTTACKLFFQRLKESEVIWEERWEPKNRVVYSRMAHELATLLLVESKAKMLPDKSSELRLHNIVMDAPIPEDDRFHRLQGAAASFTSWLLQTVPK